MQTKTKKEIESASQFKKDVIKKIAVKESKQRCANGINKDTLLRIAMLPSNLSAATAKEIIGPGAKSSSTIRRSRKRIATIIEETSDYKIRQKIVIAFPPCVQPDLKKLAPRAGGDAERIEAVPCRMAGVDVFRDQPTIIGLKWKFDSTPDKCTIKSKSDRQRG